MTHQTSVRLTIVILGGIAFGGIITLMGRPRAEAPPLPPAPVIAAERGELPRGIIAFEERVDGALMGSGFLLQLPNGDVVGVTTAHSLGEGNFYPMVFQPAGREQVAAEFDELYAPLGRPRTGADMTIDYVVMRPAVPPDRVSVLQADPRGIPQPGERVSLYSGLGDGRGQARILDGTVEAVDENGAWVRMDEFFDARLMSGSPMISQHTGKVVGMTIAMNWTPDVFRIGINPIGAIVASANR